MSPGAASEGDQPARRAERGTLEDLAAIAAAAERRAPASRWLERLADGDRHVGIAAGAVAGGWVLSVWAGETVEGDRVGALLELDAERWRALDEVAVPPPVRRWALELVAAGR